MACEMLKTEDIEIAALYNSQAEADQFAKDMGIGCNIYGFGYKDNRIVGLGNYISFLRKCSYDIINTHHSLSGALARLFCYGKIKMVHTVHANYHSYSKAQNLLIGITLNRTDAIAFNSKSSQEGLYEWEKKRIKNVKQEVIYNGVNVERIQNAGDVFWKQFCSENEIPDDAVILTQIGRLEPVKNPMGTLRAFESLKSKVDKDLWDKLFFVYMGNGSELKKMKEFVCGNELNGKVLLPGVIKRDEVYSWMKRANILVVPSFYEGFCNTLVEGLAAGMSVCISDIPVFKEILPEKAFVKRFIPDRVNTIVNSIIESIGNDNNGIEELKEYAEKRFSLKITDSHYLGLYRSLLDL